MPAFQYSQKKCLKKTSKANIIHYKFTDLDNGQIEQIYSTEFHDKKKKTRYFFPFSSTDEALMFLKFVEAIIDLSCLPEKYLEFTNMDIRIRSAQQLTLF